MPPTPHTPVDPQHMLRPPVAFGEGGLPPHKPQPVGPIVGTIIVVLLLIAGGLYFWGARINREGTAQNQIPYIPSGTTTVTIQQ